MTGLKTKNLVAGATVAVLAALAFLTLQPANSASETKASGSDSSMGALPPSGLAQPVASASSDTPSEGIKIHGAWTIVVQDPDGTVVKRRDFENGFFGSDAITGFLARSTHVGFWSVFLDGSPQQPCSSQSTPPTPNKCIIVEPATGITTGGIFFANLQMTSSAGTVRLAGSATIANTGSITGVETWVGECPTATPASTCVNGVFTSKVLTTPIAVQAGQQAQVTVVLSFS